MISKKTLEKWRKEALNVSDLKNKPSEVSTMSIRDFARVVKMLTQELLDQHLMKKGKNHE